jgi:hypothetical protein
MSEKQIAATPAAYAYPLLIKQPLHTPLMQSPQQEIVYRDVKRLTYADLRDRISRGSHSGEPPEENSWAPFLAGQGELKYCAAGLIRLRP